VENHKDFHASELADLLKQLSSPAIGACIDTGNNLALLEEPNSVVETLAPYVVTTHIKDMAVKPGPTGFFMSEVPLGEGILDLQGMIDTIKAANPAATINLEMITRDPLSIDCLTPAYWPTFPDKPASDLAMALTSIRHYASPALPSVSGQELEDILKQEDDNIIACLRYARGSLS
jgi:3-oxoisoapionate decarboxylase